LTETQKFFRFFSVPGMGHCGGGEAPNTFDAQTAIEGWVENGTAPAQLLATQNAAGKVVRSRPLCPFPQVAKHRGSGPIEDAASFTCAAR
jgi:feruloyl esterase